MAWHDRRNGTDYDIYAQRVDVFGVVQWTTHGVALCSAINDQTNPAIVSDGAGGAIVTWEDYRVGFGDLHAQRVSASGVVQWAMNGVLLVGAAGLQQLPTMISDGAGGAIATWQDHRNGGVNWDVYAQRINASGVVQWANGVALCVAANDQPFPTIISDGAAGAIVTWSDYRTGATADIYTQRVNASGLVQWTPNGVALCTAADEQSSPTIVSDGTGGAIVTWYDHRTGTNFDIYAQRVNASGVAQWPLNGVAMCTAANQQTSPTLVSDGAGGAIVTWADLRSGTNNDIYAQRVNASGVAQWPLNGVALCTAADVQVYPVIAPAGAGGAIVAWQDSRNGNSDAYSHRVDASGVVQWTTGGVAVCTAADYQADLAIVSDGAGGAIVTWADLRSGNFDIYAQRVEVDFGTWGHPEPTVISVADVPNDQGGKVAVNWKRSGHDALPLQEISHYSVWRAIDLVALSSAEAEGWTDPATIGASFNGRAAFHERVGTTDNYWEWVANQSATHDLGYAFAAATRADSVAANNAQHYFRVLAHTSNPYVLYKSNAMSGHSVDNLAPAAPLFLTAQRVGPDVHLEWNRVRVADLKNYAVYRATSMGVTPIPPNLLANDTDTVLVDASAPTSALYYIVTAYDVHENQSAASNEANVGATTGVGETPAITALALRPNHPNPFAGTTELEIGLPQESDVSIQIYDVLGRVVRDARVPRMSAGWQRVALSDRGVDGKPLASGVYFCRVTAAGRTVTQKMVIAR
ncbi:MAG TPA: T9SS type A sorting domain-containing protein [Candidatus Krumholzibacteria bacterium]|nr:T9SS type A sorting domain-containing protein [Candidatus Krumholzibacteria bacterium]